jgi:hypothetical protein
LPRFNSFQIRAATIDQGSGWWNSRRIGVALKSINARTIIIAIQFALLQSCNRNVATRCQLAVGGSID